MPHPTLKEGFTEWEIIVNPHLEFSGTETLTNGVKRYFGIDPITKKQKLMYIQYPKSHFSRSDMKRILPQYRHCKLCKIGKPVLEKKLIKDKSYTKNMNFSIIDLMGKVPLLGNSIVKNRFMTAPVVMGGLATLTRYPLAIMSTEFGKRMLSLLIGAIGLTGVRYAMKSGNVQGEWANFFANYITSAGEVNAQKTGFGFGVKDDLAKLKRAIKSRNMYGIVDSFVVNPEKIKRTLKTIQSNFSNTFRTGRLRATENTMPNKLFKSNKYTVKNASDFKYTDTAARRFREIGTFGKGFRKERRFRESGDAVYNN